MSAPQPPRADRGPLPGLLLILLAIAGLVLLVIGFNRLTAGNADARLCLPVGLILLVLFASAPLGYAAFQQEVTTAELLRRLGQSRAAWITVGAGTGVLLLAVVALSALGVAPVRRPNDTPLAQQGTPAATPATATAVATATTAATATAAGPTQTNAADTALPTATASPSATVTRAPTLRPTSTPTSAPTATVAPTETPAPTGTVTLVAPDPAAQIDQTMIEANDALVALIENPNAPRDPLRAYYCGDNAWRKITGFLTRTAARTDRPRGAAYTISDVQPAIQDLDERWRLEQVETWTYTAANGRNTTTREAYVYWLVATESGTPPFCIDDYTSQTIAS